MYYLQISLFLISSCYADRNILNYDDLRCADRRNLEPTIALNDGKHIPGLGFGTWLGFDKSGQTIIPDSDAIQKSVEWALDAGYRHIDTAYIYSNEEQVGRAIRNKIKQGVIKRDDVYITTKLWHTFHPKDAVVPALKESLRNLDMEYVDLYLIHAPIALHDNGSIDPNTDYMETWEGMIEAREQGLTKSIGVSNFNRRQLERLLTLSNVTPAILQNEINLNLQQPALLAYCRSKNITVSGYTPFGSLFPQKALPDAPPPRVDEPALVQIAQKYNKTVPQIVLRYILELGVIPIAKSVTKARVEENIQIFDFTLSDTEHNLLRSYDAGYKILLAKEWIASPYYSFGEE